MSAFLQVKSLKNGVISFIKHPSDFKKSDSTTSNKVTDVLVLVAFKLVLIIPLGMIIYLLDDYEIIEMPEHVGEELFQRFSFIELIFYVAILAPFIEEVLFRGFVTLRRCYPALLFIDLMESLGGTRFDQVRKVKRFWRWFFPLVITVSTVMFAYVHIWNFRGDVDFWLVPLLVSPQMIAGIFLAFTRVRYGLVWSMLSHSSYNFILLILHYLFPMN